MQPKLNKTSPYQLLAWNPRRIKPSEDFAPPEYCIDLPHANNIFSTHQFPRLQLTKPCFQISGIMLHLYKFLVTLEPFHLDLEASDSLNPGTSDFLNLHPSKFPSIWHSAYLKPTDSQKYLQSLSTCRNITNACQPLASSLTHTTSLCSSSIFATLTYTTSEPAQSSDLQLPYSYQGIIDICCHSVGPSHMVVLRIPLWLTHYDFYYQQGIEQQFFWQSLTSNIQDV